MRSSLMMDVVAGRPTEADAILGGVVRRARKAGIDTPVMQALLAVLGHGEKGKM
jgi:2-dehydropantoate 2-reductase